ncbi:MAG TPA: hypothetical protein VF941_16475 [Clostridia bacterium]
MKKIVLSADNYPCIYIVPDFIAGNMKEYIDQFFDWLYNENNDHGYWVKTSAGELRGVCYTEEAYIKWLNEFVVGDSEKAILVEKKKVLTEVENLYPRFNF